jgi:hypothetical protein
MIIAVFTEDRYGPGFIKKVINRLISEEYVKENIEFAKLGNFVRMGKNPALIKKCHNVGKKVKAIIKDVDRVLIVIDKEDSYNYDENREIWRHLKDLKEEYRKKIRVIALEPEIEEWICISLSLNFDKTGYDKTRKPSKVLERSDKYEKSKLDRYVEKLDFETLLKKSSSFRDFYNSLL